jgi:hypothetical protein
MTKKKIDGATFLRMLHEWAARTDGVKAVYAGMECRGSIPVVVIRADGPFDFALHERVCRMEVEFADDYGVRVHSMLQTGGLCEQDGVGMPQVFPHNDFLQIVEEGEEALRDMASGGCLSHEEAWRVLLGDKHGTV